MLLMALAGCGDLDTVVDVDGAAPENDTAALESDTAALESDTAALPAAQTSVTECPIVGTWSMMIRGWTDQGWTVTFTQSDTGCLGATQTALSGTIDIVDIVPGSGNDWSATGTYTGLFERSPEPLVFRETADGWEVDGLLIALASVWTLTPL